MKVYWKEDTKDEIENSYEREIILNSIAIEESNRNKQIKVSGLFNANVNKNDTNVIDDINYFDNYINKDVEKLNIKDITNDIANGISTIKNGYLTNSKDEKDVVLEESEIAVNKTVNLHVASLRKETF